jgi:hypothetical protein
MPFPKLNVSCYCLADREIHLSARERRMDKPVIRYRTLLTLVTIAFSAILITGNNFLPAGYQLFAWGVAIGVLSTFVYIVFTWFLDFSLIWLVPVIPITGAALRYAFGFGFGYPKGDYYWIGEGMGLAIMITIALVLPLRRPTQSSRPRPRTMPPLEDSSPHTLIMPRAPEPRSDKTHSR